MLQSTSDRYPAFHSVMLKPHLFKRNKRSVKRHLQLNKENLKWTIFYVIVTPEKTWLGGSFSCKSKAVDIKSLKKPSTLWVRWQRWVWKKTWGWNDEASESVRLSLKHTQQTNLISSCPKIIIIIIHNASVHATWMMPSVRPTSLIHP